MKRERLDWLDLTRLLCACMILGIHWLRACFKVELFGVGEANVLVDGYQNQSIGLGMLPHVLVAGTAPTAATWLANVVGILGGFGWEAVSALVIVSGFSLTLSLGEKRLDLRQWAAWLLARGKRILYPFYLVAIPFVGIYVALLFIVPTLHGAFFAGIDAKLRALFHTPPLGIVFSHVLLFDPYQRQGVASMFAPAWWFVPAILVAYVAYPAFVALARRSERALLAIAAAVTIGSYALADRRVLIDESWYFIALMEAFNLALGIALARAWQMPERREAIESALASPYAFAIGLTLFVDGNLANWSPVTRPIASMLFGPGLLLLLVAISFATRRSRFASLGTTIDSYDLYLVHQPFAYPIALAARFLFHGYAVFLGMVVFYATAIGVSLGFGRVRARLERPRSAYLPVAAPIVRE
ncbi:MAG: hypothetical protein NVS2B3_01500 [Vulcanimicrobiaceae bacterium]